MADENAWTTIASTYFLAEADVIRSVLAEHDIEVFLKGEHTAGLAAPLSLMDRGVRVQVRHEDEARALEILRDFEPADIDEEPGTGDDEPFDDEPAPWLANPRAMWAVITGAALAWIVLRLVLGK